jgi:Mg2+/Co2+ transporter CorB
VLRLLSNPRRLIVTIIVCNELINILTSSLSATVVHELLPHLAEVWQVIIAALATVPMLLLLGEMTPKSIAIRTGENWSRAVSWPLQTVMYVIAPLRVVLSTVAGAVLAPHRLAADSGAGGTARGGVSRAGRRGLGRGRAAGGLAGTCSRT